MTTQTKAVPPVEILETKFQKEQVLTIVGGHFVHDTFQEHLPDNRALANGLYLSITFLARPLAALILGLLGDNFGLRSAYFWSAVISLGAIPMICLISERSKW